MVQSKQRTGIFLGVVGVILVLFYDGFWSKPPQNMHLWRQTDCLSLTKHFYEGNGLLSPEMHTQLGDAYNSGRSAGEFTGYYYVVGQVWKVLGGESLLAYRLIGLSFLLTACFFFYKAIRVLLPHSYWPELLTLFLLSSPAYLIYSVSFLTDAPSISLVIIALYTLLRYVKSEKKTYLAYTFALFALAGLLKISSLIVFVFLLGIWALEQLGVQTLRNKKVFAHPWFTFSLVFSVLASVVSWYLYAAEYNQLHGFKYTFNAIHPIWVLDAQKIQSILNEIATFMVPLFWGWPALVMIMVAFFINLFSFKKLPLFAWLASLVVFIGGIAYMLLWFPLMGIHDYYYVVLIIVFPATIIPMIYALGLQKHQNLKSFNFLIPAVLIAFILVNNYPTIRVKTGANKPYEPVLTVSNFLGDIAWFNQDYKDKWKPLYQMRKDLDSLGIDKTDKVIVLPDFSFNTGLYMIDQKGWSSYLEPNASLVQAYIEHGAKFLFILNNDEQYYAIFEPYIVREIPTPNNVKLYEISATQTE